MSLGLAKAFLQEESNICKSAEIQPLDYRLIRKGGNIKEEESLLCFADPSFSPNRGML